MKYFVLFVPNLRDYEGGNDMNHQDITYDWLEVTLMFIAAAFLTAFVYVFIQIY